MKALGAGAVTQGPHIRRYLSHDQSAGSPGGRQWFSENPSLLDTPMYVCMLSCDQTSQARLANLEELREESAGLLRVMAADTGRWLITDFARPVGA